MHAFTLVSLAVFANAAPHVVVKREYVPTTTTPCITTTSEVVLPATVITTTGDAYTVVTPPEETAAAVTAEATTTAAYVPQTTAPCPTTVEEALPVTATPTNDAYGQPPVDTAAPGDDEDDEDDSYTPPSDSYKPTEETKPISTTDYSPPSDAPIGTGASEYESSLPGGGFDGVLASSAISGGSSILGMLVMMLVW